MTYLIYKVQARGWFARYRKGPAMNELIIGNGIAGKILAIRGLQVMLGSNLAELYGVETKILNRAVSRNVDRFPEEFRFRLNKEESENLRSQIVISSGTDDLRFQNGTSSGAHGGRRYLLYVFTEQGVAMLSAMMWEARVQDLVT